METTIGKIIVCLPTPSDAPTEIDNDQRQRLKRRNDAWDNLIASLGARYAETTLANFTADRDDQRKAVVALRGYSANIDERIAAGVGIVLFGPSGSGKDHLLSALAKRAVAMFHSVSWWNGADLFGAMRDRIGEAQSEEAFIRRLESPDVLVLSDPLPPAGPLTDFQATTLYRIVDRRYRMRKPTWVSINVASGEEADRRLGTAITDRLRDGALCLHCKWPSHRMPAGLSEDPQ